MSDPIHSAAQGGYAAEAGRYASGRPEYPEALKEWLRAELGLGPSRRVLDLGAGTGKFTKLLMETGAEVCAVEPVAAMREQLAARLPGAQVLEGRAQAIPLPDESLDAVVCAQAFHWFASRESLEEMHRVLKPGGRLGLVWNVRDESVDWMAAITAIITPFEGDAPRYYKGDWRKPFDEGFEGFGPLELHSLPHEHVGPPAQVIVDRFLSVSFIAALDDAAKAGVAAQLRHLVDHHPALRGRETVAVPYRTEAFVARRR
ncbi:class I SAM-dependent methyltransferase [Burkholderiaceae bacterium UC74_6]